MDNSFAWAAVIIIALLLFFNQGGQTGLSILNFSGGGWGGNWTFTYPTPYATPTPQVVYVSPTPIHVNLCNLALPYMHDLSACAAAGGTFTCLANEVSCVGTGVPLDCFGPAAISGQHQCNVVGANWHCDAANIWCRY